MSAVPWLAFAGSSAVEPGSPLPAALAAELGLREHEWVAAGIRGSRLRRWARPELPAGLRAIVVLLTANDAHPTAAAVREVDAALRALAPVVVWLPPMPFTDASPAAGRDARMRAALAGAGVAWVDRPIRIEPDQWAPDRVHLTRAGYRAYARQVGADLARRVSLPSSAGLLGHVQTAGGRRLPLSSLDAVWLARALVGEGGTAADAIAISSTMVRRWAMLRDASASSPFGTLADLVVGRFDGPDPHEGDGRGVELRGYSQPVAVQWRGRGVERRRRIRQLGWDDIEPWRRTAVLRVLTGRVALSAPAAVHFAAPEVVARQLRRHPDWQRVPVSGARNEFASVPQSRLMHEPVVVGTDGRSSADLRSAPSDPGPRHRAPIDELVPAAPPETAAGPTPARRPGSMWGPGLLLAGVAVLGVAAVARSARPPR